MKFSINRSEFMKHLSDVQRAIASKTAIPILTGIKLVLTQDALYLTGSDANISIEKIIPVSEAKNQLVIESPGKIVLPSRFFGEIIKKLDADSVTVSLLSQYKVEIKSDKSVFTINGVDADLYPTIDNIEQDSNNSIQLPTFLFKTVLSQTMLAASTSENRPLLTGINLTIANGQLTAVATDSHRMSKRVVQLPEIGEDISYSCTIPAKSLNELSKIISDDAHLTMVQSDTKVLFISENLYFYSRLLEGNYPDVSRLLKQEMKTHLKLSASDFLKAVDRVAILSTEGRNDIVTLTIDQEGALLSSESPEIGYVEENVLVEAIEGPGLKIAFNPNYMKDALRVLNHNDIVISFLEEGRPFTLKLADDANNHFIQLITPIRTRN